MLSEELLEHYLSSDDEPQEELPPELRAMHIIKEDGDLRANEAIRQGHHTVFWGLKRKKWISWKSVKSATPIP